MEEDKQEWCRHEQERNTLTPTSGALSGLVVGCLLNDRIEYVPHKRNAIVIDAQMSRSPDNYSGKEKEHEETLKLELTPEEISLFAKRNTRALLKTDRTYRMEKFEKNAFIIFNQENINGYTRPRSGTRKDAEALMKTFGEYGFEIEVHCDLDKDEIFRALKRFSEKDFTDYGCVAVAILTHGSDMGELKARDRSFNERDVINFFKRKPTLLTKPKVFIIQACRGSETTQAVQIMKHGKISTNHEDSHLKHYTMPVESDTLILHSTSAGKISHRDETLGSWFIQTLCRKIDELASREDLEAIITEVKREIAIEKTYEAYNRRTHQTDCNKQMPVVTSTLIRKLYLRKYEDDTKETKKNTVFYSANDTIAKTHSSASISESENEDKPFEHLRTRMRRYVKDNPGDETAQSLLDVAEVLQKGPEFNLAKDTISKAIKKHFIHIKVTTSTSNMISPTSPI